MTNNRMRLFLYISCKSLVSNYWANIIFLLVVRSKFKLLGMRATKTLKNIGNSVHPLPLSFSSQHLAFFDYWQDVFLVLLYPYIS